MKYKIYRFNIVLFLTLTYGVYSCGQDLNKELYINLVKRNNIEIKLVASQVKISKAELGIAKSLFLPNLALEGVYQRDFTKNFLFINDEFDGTVTEFRTNFNNTLDLNAIASQTLFDASSITTLKIAKLSEELSKLNYWSASTDLVAQASMLYWQTLFVRESVEVLEANASLAKEQVDQFEIVFKRGAISELQLQQAKALYRKSLPVLNNTRNQYHNLLNELKYLAGIPIKNEIELTEELEDLELEILTKRTSNKIEEQPEIKARKKELEIAERQVIGKKNFWLPKINLVAGYNYNGQDDDFNLANSQNKLFFGQVRINVPIFSGGSNRGEISKAEIERKAAELNLKDKRKDFIKQLQIVKNNYNNSIENITLHKETIVINEREMEIFKKKLSLGVVTPLEFKEARLRLTQSRLELLNSYLALHNSKLQMDRILGEKD